MSFVMCNRFYCPICSCRDAENQEEQTKNIVNEFLNRNSTLVMVAFIFNLYVEKENEFALERNLIRLLITSNCLDSFWMTFLHSSLHIICIRIYLIARWLPEHKKYSSLTNGPPFVLFIMFNCCLTSGVLWWGYQNTHILLFVYLFFGYRKCPKSAKMCLARDHNRAIEWAKHTKINTYFFYFYLIFC